MLSQASMSLEYWDHAVTSSVYLINRLPSSAIQNEGPFQKLFHKLPDYKFLKFFGCACFPLLRPYNQHKLQPRSRECVFLGYSLSHKGYKCLAADGRIYVSKDDVFNELKFPFPHLMGKPDQPSSTRTANPSTLTVLQSHQNFSLASSANTSQTASVAPQAAVPPALSTSSSCSSSPSQQGEPQSFSASTARESFSASPAAESLPQGTAPPDASIRPANVRPMCTRAKAGVVKPRLHPTLLLAHSEPKSTKTALSNPTWYAAMKAEYETLMSNGTWPLTDLPPSRSSIGCK